MLSAFSTMPSSPAWELTLRACTESQRLAAFTAATEKPESARASAAGESQFARQSLDSFQVEAHEHPFSRSMWGRYAWE